MTQYIIKLPNEKLKSYRYITLFILISNVASFGYQYLYPPDERTAHISSFGLVLSCLYLIIYFVKYYTKYFNQYKLEISFIILGVVWLVAGNIIFALVLFACAAMGWYAAKDPVIRFTDEGIIYPGINAKKIMWSDVTNVILKDDVLTIDLDNNRLLQVTISKESADQIDINEFNAFVAGKAGKQM